VTVSAARSRSSSRSDDGQTILEATLEAFHKTVTCKFGREGALTKLRHIPLNRSVAYRLAVRSQASLGGVWLGAPPRPGHRDGQTAADHSGSALSAPCGYAVGAHPMG